MKKLLLLTCLIFTLSLKTQIHWNDLGNTFVGFYQEDQPEEIKKMSHYSPLFGALAFKSGDIKKDWLKAKDLDEKETTAFYNYFITGALSIKKEHAAFSLQEPINSLTDEAVNELLEKNKKFSSIVHTSRSFLSLTGNDLLFKALKQCYEKKYETIAEDLINEEIDVNTQEASSLFTPLLLAIKHQASEKIIKLLIDHGADINAQDSYEKTPLHLAMLTYLSLNDERINILLSAHPNVNLKDHEQCTVLNRLIQSLGSESDLLPFIKKLIALGAEINTTDKYGRSPLSYKHLDEEVQEYLTEELKKQTQSSAQPDDNQ